MVQRESQGINSTFDILNQNFLDLLESGWDTTMFIYDWMAFSYLHLVHKILPHLYWYNELWLGQFA